MNEKAYKFSTRDSTEFTVEEGSDGAQVFNVTISCTDPNTDVFFQIPVAIEETPVGACAVSRIVYAREATIPSITLPVVAYKGTCVIQVQSPNDNPFDIQVTGGIEIVFGSIVVTGDGEIIVSAEGEPEPDPDPILPVT